MKQSRLLHEAVFTFSDEYIAVDISYRKRSMGGWTVGLFFNRKNDLNIYKGEQISERNQAIYRSDSVTKAIEVQKKAFDEMNVKYSDMEKQIKKQRRIQSDRWKTTSMRFDEIVDNQSQHHQFEKDAIEALDRLDRQNIELQNVLNQKKKANEDLVNQINMLNHANSEIAERLDKFDTDQEILLQKMDEQLEKQHQFSVSLEEQKTTQLAMVDKLEQQEGLIDKMMRQMDFLKSVVFERSHFIAEKIDKSYQLTTTYISSLKGKSKQSHSE